MKLEEATDKVIKLKTPEFFIFGVIPNDGEFRVDGCVALSEKDKEKELEKYLTVRVWEIGKEITNLQK